MRRAAITLFPLSLAAMLWIGFALGWKAYPHSHPETCTEAMTKLDYFLRSYESEAERQQSGTTPHEKAAADPVRYNKLVEQAHQACRERDD